MALALGNWSALASMPGMDDAEFAHERRHELLSALAGLLTTEGLLMLGPGEMTGFTHLQLSRVPHQQALAYLRNP